MSRWIETGETAAHNFMTITPSDSVDLPERLKFIRVGGSGNLSVIGEDGGFANFNNVSGVLKISPRRVRSTGTTATNIIGCF